MPVVTNLLEMVLDRDASGSGALFCYVIIGVRDPCDFGIDPDPRCVLNVSGSGSYPCLQIVDADFSSYLTSDKIQISNRALIRIVYK